MNRFKALIVQTNGTKDLGDILQIARAEAMKLFRNPCKIQVVFHTSSPYGEILVVQNTEGCIGESKSKKCIKDKKLEN